MQEIRHSTIAGFVLPAGLDVSAYDDVGEQAARLANPNDPSRTQKKNAFVAYAGAWNGFIVRFSAAATSSIRFGKILASNNPGFAAMLERERVLFECICSLTSAFECIYFAAYCIASEVSGSPVVLDRARDLRVYAPHVVGVYRSWMPAEHVTDELERFATSFEYSELKDLRDVLAHRGNVPPTDSFDIAARLHAATGAQQSEGPRTRPCNRCGPGPGFDVAKGGLAGRDLQQNCPAAGGVPCATSAAMINSCQTIQAPHSGNGLVNAQYAKGALKRRRDSVGPPENASKRSLPAWLLLTGSVSSTACRKAAGPLRPAPSVYFSDERQRFGFAKRKLCGPQLDGRPSWEAQLMPLSARRETRARSSGKKPPSR